MSLLSWKLHGNGKNIAHGDVVSTDERLTWPRTIGVGVQHIAAMFGATFLVPIITGFPPTTTLLFSGIGTLLFLIITQNKVPSYLGSSFAFLAPIAAAQTGGGKGACAAWRPTALCAVGRRGAAAGHFAHIHWIGLAHIAGLRPDRNQPGCQRQSAVEQHSGIGRPTAPGSRSENR